MIGMMSFHRSESTRTGRLARLKDTGPPSPQLNRFNSMYLLVCLTTEVIRTTRLRKTVWLMRFRAALISLVRVLRHGSLAAIKHRSVMIFSMSWIKMSARATIFLAKISLLKVLMALASGSGLPHLTIGDTCRGHWRGYHTLRSGGAWC